MKNIKKFLATVLCVAIMLTAAPLSGLVGLELPDWLDFSIKSEAADLTDSGSCGSGVYWSYYESTGELVINGNGSMNSYTTYKVKDDGLHFGETHFYPHYFYYSTSPWDKYRSDITSITIGDGVTAIGNNAFYRFKNINKITIGKSLNFISDSAFNECELSGAEYDLYFTGSIFDWCIDSEARKYLLNYVNKLYINGASGNVVIPDGVTNIPYRAFYSCSDITSVIIPDSVTSIGDYAFSGCTSLTSVTIPDSVTSIGSNAFYDCDSLASIAIPDSVTSIGNHAFYGCTSLTSITISDSVTSIGNDAFYNTEYYNDSSNWENNVLYIGNYLIDAKTSMSGNYEIKEGTILVANYAFAYCDSLTSVTIGDGVILIGNYAFAYCDSLTSVTIGDSVTSIGSFAFYDCDSLASVTIPDSVTTIGSDAFSNCDSLTSITIPDSVTTIGSSAFYCCTSLESITIPDSVTSIDYDAFYKTAYYNNSSNWENEVLYIGNHLIKAQTSISGGYEIKEGTILIANNAFYNCDKLTSVTIGDCVTIIGSSAFEDCNKLTSVTIGDSVKTIGDNAFSSCSKLTDVSFTGDIASWCEIDFTNNYSNPMSYAKNINIDGMSLSETLKIPKGVTSVQDYTFHGFPINELVIPSSITYIGKGAFANCDNLITKKYTGTKEQWDLITIDVDNVKLKSGIIFESESDRPYYSDSCGENLKWKLFIDTGELIFEGSGDMTNDSSSLLYRDYVSLIKSVTIPDSVTSIGSSAFEDCDSLTSITIPDSVTSIGSSAFEDCDSLTSITIPDSVTTIGNSAFSYCDSLTSVYITDISAWCNIDFEYVSSNPLYYGAYLYLNGEKVTDLVIPDDITELKEYTFYNCTSLESVTIGDGVTTIGSYAFYGCDSLTSVIIGDSVTSIGNYAFSGCDSLTSVTIPDSVTSIGTSAFSDCTSLTSITIPDSVTTIGGDAFYGCTSLESITIPDSVTSIGSYAFYGCTSLESITIPDSVTSIGNYAFSGCTSLTSVIIGDSVTSIGNYAFYKCTSLTNVTIGDSVTSIGNYAFNYCNRVKIVNIKDVSAWCSIDFSNLYSNPLQYYGADLYINGDKLTDLVIPDDVMKIKAYAFDSCYSLESVSIPDSVTSIGDSAFAGCVSLTSITIPDSVTSIYTYAFNSCTSLTSITLPNSINSIGYGVFRHCTSLESVTIPDGVTSIGEIAFEDCTSLTSVTIGDGVTSIGKDAFYGCSKISKTYYTGTIAQWYKISISSGNTYLTKNVVYDCNSLRTRQDMGTCGEGLEWVLYTDGELVISGTGDMTDYDASTVAPWDSSKSLIKLVTINDGVTSIGDYAFNNMSAIQTLTITDDIQSVGVSAFAGASGLTDVYYSGAESDWNEITIGNSNGYLKNSEIHFNHTHNYTQVVLESSTCIVNGHCKFECECGSIQKYDYLPLGVHTPGEWKTNISAGCLTEGTKQKECTVCKTILETESIPAIGHKISDWKTDVSAKCTSDGSKHKECTVCKVVLETEVIPAKGHNIGDWTISKNATTSAEGKKVKKCTVCYTVLETEVIPKLDPVCDYLKWRVSGDYIVITGFYSGLSGDVVLPETINGYPVEEIDEAAFINSKITSIQIPSGVTRIGQCAFSYCSNLKSVTIPWGVNTIDPSAFVGCTNLEEIKIYDDYYKEYTNDGLFFKTDERGVLFWTDYNGGTNKTALFYAPAKAVGEAYTIPDYVTSAKDSAFADCKDFSLTLSDNFDMEYDSLFFKYLSVNEFIASENCANFSTIDGVLYNKDATKLVKYPVDSNKQIYVVPDSVTNIASDSVFYVMEEEQEIIMMYNLSLSFSNIIKTPAHLTVHIPSKNISINKLLVGPSHYCVAGYSQAEIDAGNSLVSEEIAEWTDYWNEIRYEMSSGSKEYQMMYNYITCMKNAYGTFETCEEDHTNPYPFSSVISTVKATCTEDGYNTYECSECGYYFEVVIKSTGHNYKSIVIEPTCTANGYTKYICLNCRKSYKDNTTEKVGHSYVSKVTEPTCTMQGYTTYTCNCGDSYVDDYVSATGHSYEKVVTVPTCVDRGYTTYTCDCGYSYIGDYVGATGHSYTSKVTTPATHTTIGIKTHTCNCGNTYTEIIDKLPDHSYETVVTPPTCTEDGYTTYTCICGDLYIGDRVSALGHTNSDVVEENYVAPTCTENGSKDNVTYCTVCNVETNRETVVVSATGHNHVNGKCENCGDNDVYYYNGTFHIQSPSTTSIRHKDGIKLHAKVEGTAPAGSYVKWTASNSNFKTEEINSGNSFKIISDKNGTTTFTATLFSAEGEVLATDTIEMKSKAGFFDKIGSFFRSIFGGTKIHEK